MRQGFWTIDTSAREPTKLSELRAKTDRQLHDLVDSKLDDGLSFAVLAEVEESAGDRTYAERSIEGADQALAEVQRLFPALNEEQRRAFDPKLTELREALDRWVRHRTSAMTQTASAFG